VITLTLLHPLKPIPVQTWTFQDDESVIRVGRSTDNNVILYSAVVSRYHVELRRTGPKWEVVNLGTNGTYIDGKRITQVPIVDGAIIRLARSGPNLQIRMGSEAVQNLPNVAGDRFTNPLPGSPPIETEITADHQTEKTDRPHPQNSQDSSDHQRAG
jgi:eukaryotic-like serine/threonine-protein kinase